MTKTPQDSAYWDWDDEKESIDANSGINSGRAGEDYGSSHPSKADKGFQR